MATGWIDHQYPTLDVDFIAQTVGNLAVDLAAQTLSSISVNLASQVLAQVITRLKFGTFNMIQAAVGFAAGQTQAIASITGKGAIYGLNFWADHAAADTSSIFQVVVDGGSTYSLYWVNLYTWNFSGAHYNMAKLTGYDTVNHIYSLNGLNGVTFETSLVIGYSSVAAASTTRLELYYSVL